MGMEPNTQFPPDALLPQPLEGPQTLISSAWSLYKKHWKLLSGIAAAPSFLLYATQVLYALVPGPLPRILVLVSAVIAIVGAVAMYPALASALHRLQAEAAPGISIKGQYGIGFRLFWSVLLLSVIHVLMLLGSAVLALIPAIIVAVYVSPYIFSLVVDGKKGFAAFTEAYGLVRGRWWGVFGRIAFFILIGLIGGLIVSGAEYLLVSLMKFGTLLSDRAATTVVKLILNFVFNAIILPIGVGYSYRLYLSLKATRSAAAQTAVFKNLLIAFMTIGIVAIPLLFGAVFVTYARKYGPPKNWPINREMPLRNPVTGTGTPQQ